jgi:hypothetical protein
MSFVYVDSLDLETMENEDVDHQSHNWQQSTSRESTATFHTTPPGGSFHRKLQCMPLGYSVLGRNTMQQYRQRLFHKI